SKATPTISVTDAGGTYNGNPFPATGKAVGVNNATVAGSFRYVYSVKGTPSATAPSNAGTYTVVATFTSANANYNTSTADVTANTSRSATDLQPPPLTISGSASSGNPFPARGTAVGMNNATVAGSVSYAYYVGSSVSGTPSATAPSNAGTYTVVATFTSNDAN